MKALQHAKNIGNGGHLTLITCAANINLTNLQGPHSVYLLFAMFPSGRHYKTIYAHTSRLSKSFFSRTVMLLYQYPRNHLCQAHSRTEHQQQMRTQKTCLCWKLPTLCAILQHYSSALAQSILRSLSVSVMTHCAFLSRSVSAILWSILHIHITNCSAYHEIIVCFISRMNLYWTVYI